MKFRAVAAAAGAIAAAFILSVAPADILSLPTSDGAAVFHHAGPDFARTEAVVPEPQISALLLIGVGLVGTSVRPRKRASFAS